MRAVYLWTKPLRACCPQGTQPATTVTSTSSDITYKLRCAVQTNGATSGNEPYIELASRNEFLSPQIRFGSNTEVGKIAELKKGQQIKVVCVGDGAIIGSAMFKDCQFAIDYINTDKFKKIKSDIGRFLNGEKVDSDKILVMTITSITMARSLPETSSCFTDLGNKCRQEMQTFINSSKTRDEKFSAVTAELRSLGVQVPELKTSNQPPSK